VKVLRYEVKNLTPPEVILRAMQPDPAEREKARLIAKSEGEKQQEINLAEGEKQARSSPPKARSIGDQQGAGRGDGAARGGGCDRRRGERRWERSQGRRAAGRDLKVAELYIGAFATPPDQQHHDRAFELSDVRAWSPPPLTSGSTGPGPREGRVKLENS